VTVRSSISAGGDLRAARSTPDPVDIHVGRQMRQRRRLLGMTQSQLGKALGEISFQQIQKYERGSNRIAASRLHQLAAALGVGVAFFFEGLPPEARQDGSPRWRNNGASPAAATPDDLLLRRETVELTRYYYEIADPSVRRRLYDLIKALSRLGNHA
jgi:transcriptional regulator with XRE-family HTH domain